MARIDHTNCSHPRTPAARSACRKIAQQRSLGINVESSADSSANRGVVVDSTPDYIADQIRATVANHKMKARMDRDYAKIRAAARAARAAESARTKAAGRLAKIGKPSPIKPSDDGNDYAHCVQAALHTGYGRCACGWHRGCPSCGNESYRADVTGPDNGFCGRTYCHYALAN